MRIGTGTVLRSKVHALRMGTYRRIALLAWGALPVQTLNDRFQADRITKLREFFRLSPELLECVNQCREKLGFHGLILDDLSAFGDSLEDPSDQLPWAPAWVERLSTLAEHHQIALRRLLSAMNLRSEERRSQRDRLLEWLEGPADKAPDLESFGLKAAADSRLLAEEQSRQGRFHTHRRWHKQPNPSCEFCINPVEG